MAAGGGGAASPARSGRVEPGPAADRRGHAKTEKGKSPDRIPPADSITTPRARRASGEHPGERQ